MTGESTGTIIQSLSRGLTILEWLADEEEGLSLAETAARLGVSRSTAFNLLHTLIRHGFAAKTARPTRYLLGSAPWELVKRRRHWQWNSRVEEVFEELGESLPDCFLFYCENAGGDIHLALRRDPARPGWIDRTPDHRILPYVMALSQGYLAFCDDEERAEYLRLYPFEEYGRQRWQRFDDLEHVLDQARSRGFLAIEAAPCRVVVPVYRSKRRLVGLLCASRPGKEAFPATVIPRLYDALRNAVSRVQSGVTRSDNSTRGRPIKEMKPLK